MPSLIAIFLPSLIATLIIYRGDVAIRGKKILYTEMIMLIITNLPVWVILRGMGMKQYNIFQMSWHFLLNWFLLGILSGMTIAFGWIRIRYDGVKELSRRLKRIFPAVIFFVITVLIYAPAALYLNNIQEFNVAAIKGVPIFIIIGLFFCIFLVVIGLCFAGDKGIPFYISLIFALGLGAYVQSNFLNPQFPAMDGTVIDWSLYSENMIISGIVWGGIFLVTMILMLWRKKLVEVGIKYLSILLTMMQLVSLIVLCFTCKLNPVANIVFTKEGEFELSENKNIILFIVDTLQEDALQEYIESEYYEDGLFDDFTFFTNTVTGGAPTIVAVPLLLTGREYDPMQEVGEYRTDIFNDNYLFEMMNKKDYDICLFTDWGALGASPEDYVRNCVVTDGASIGDAVQFINKMYQLAGFYIMPQILKPALWMSTEQITSTIDRQNHYDLNNIEFYYDFQQAGKFETIKRPCFRLYHLDGVHREYYSNENLQEEESSLLTEQQVLRGIAKELSAYLRQLKEENLYDNSMILIMGDHGRHEIGNTEVNAAVMVKRPNEHHSLEYNRAPVCFRNIYATMVEEVEEDKNAYGASIYDLSENSDVERWHTINGTLMPRVSSEWKFYENMDYARLIIRDPEQIDQWEKWIPTAVNAIDYKLGDKISFIEKTDKYASQISDEITKVKDGAVFGSETSICFNLENYNDRDLGFSMKYDEVYGNGQTLRIYINGHKNGVYELEESDGELTVQIPAEYIEENRVIIRMVYPKAVMSGKIEEFDGYDRDVAVKVREMCLQEIQ